MNHNESSGMIPPIFMGVIKKELYDSANEEMHPMIKEELGKTEIDSEKLKQSLKQKVPVYIYSVFVRADYQTVCKMRKGDAVFEAVIETSVGEFPAGVCVRKAQRYEKLLREMYSAFCINGLSWHTVFTGYIDKMLDVFLTDADLPREAKIREVRVDFREYSPCVCYDYIPLWNVEPVTFTTDKRPVPSADFTCYKHYINGLRLDPGSLYLITEPRIHIVEIERQEDIVITSLEEHGNKWDACRFGSTIQRSYDEKVAGSIYYMDEPKLLRTRAAIARYIRLLGFEEVMSLCRMELVQSPKDGDIKPETYDMNAFIDDELRSYTHMQILKLCFQPSEPDYYLNRDIMSYLVSQIQRELPEFYCIGVIILH